jgi:hypothetical protein
MRFQTYVLCQPHDISLSKPQTPNLCDEFTHPYLNFMTIPIHSTVDLDRVEQLCKNEPECAGYWIEDIYDHALLFCKFLLSIFFMLAKQYFPMFDILSFLFCLSPNWNP